MSRDHESEAPPDVVIGIDVGGTFIDVVAIERATGAVRAEKVLSTPADLSTGIMEGLEKTFGPGLDAAVAAARVVHATTSATNALLEGETSRVGLITNRGFRDVLEIRRHARPDAYDMGLEVAPPLVPRDLRLEIDARLAPDGTVLVPVDPDQVAAVTGKLREEGVRSYTVSLLHAYARPGEERAVAEIVRREDPGAYVTCSAEVCPEHREYERTSTAVVNAAVMPLVDAYLDHLEQRLRDRGYARPLHIMQSSGGMMTAAEIRAQPVNIIESGPAAGVVSCLAVGRRLGRKNLLSFDMGGTTAKAALIHEGRIDMSAEYEVGSAVHGGHGGGGYGAGYPIRVPFMDVVEVGAGGGSIAWIDEAGGLRVGPGSAGAEPGPVCYGRGGDEPTTTDANLYLGRLSPEYFLGGEMALDLPRVEFALGRLAERLGMDALELAAGITEISNSHMVRALRRVSVERGRHPSQYAMVAFGGAGPLHACYLAEELGVREVIVPPLPGLASAVGLLGADMRHEARCAFFGRLSTVDREALTGAFAELAERARAAFAGAGIAADRIDAGGAADMRYVGQAYELTVDLPGLAGGPDALAEAAARFHDAHRRLYAYDMPEREIEIAGLRVTATATVDRPPEARLAPGGAAPRPKGRRSVHFHRKGALDCPVFERSDLHADDRLAGPAVVEQRDSTTLLPPGWALAVEPFGHLILEDRR